jgi:FMN-dependent NADH-azoreductase
MNKLSDPKNVPVSFDHQAPYIDFWLRLIGVHEVHSVVVDNAWNQDHAQSEASLAAAKQSVERIVRGFWGLGERTQPPTLW